MKNNCEEETCNIIYRPYFDAITKDGIVQVRDRAILTTEREEIEKYENELKKKNLQFRKIKHGRYYYYWILF